MPNFSVSLSYISGFQPGFRMWLPGVPPMQTEFSWDEIRNHSSMLL